MLITEKVGPLLGDGFGRRGAVEYVGEAVETSKAIGKPVKPTWSRVDIPTTYWRSVGFSQNTFFSESFLDELAVAAGKDPFEFRRHLLAKSPCLLGVLELAGEKFGWAKPLPAGQWPGHSSRQQDRQL